MASRELIVWPFLQVLRVLTLDKDTLLVLLSSRPLPRRQSFIPSRRPSCRMQRETAARVLRSISFRALRSSCHGMIRPEMLSERDTLWLLEFLSSRLLNLLKI